MVRKIHLVLFPIWIVYVSIVPVLFAQIPTLSIENGFSDSTVLLTVGLSNTEGVNGFDFFIDLSQSDLLFTGQSNFMRNDDFFPEFKFLNHGLNVTVEVEPRKFRLVSLAPDSSQTTEIGRFTCKVAKSAQPCETQVINLTGQINIKSSGIREVELTSTEFIVLSKDINGIPEKPTVANAGEDQATCSNSTILEANTPVIGTGKWSIVSGTRGRIINSTDPNTKFTGIVGNTYVLKWTISNFPCPPSEDLVEIFFDNIQPICKTINHNNIITIPISDPAGIKKIVFWGEQENLASLNPPPPYSSGIDSLTIVAIPRDNSRPPSFTIAVTDMCGNRNICEVP